MAWFLVALQLSLALHFALVPHRLGTELGRFGLVHIDGHSFSSTEKHRALTHRSPSALEHAFAASDSDPCSLAFAGLSTVLFAPPALSSLLECRSNPRQAEPNENSFARHRLLLSAPKTSPPRV